MILKIFIFLFFSLLLSQNIPTTNVHIVLNSHNDLIWVEPLYKMYNGTATGYYSYACVKCIFDSIIPILLANSTRTYTVSEMYFLLMYYKQNFNNEKGSNLKKLIQNKQMIIGNSGLAIVDQATTHYDDIIDQFTYGRRKVFELFGIKQEDGWALDTFGGSHAYKMILRQFGIKNMILDRISESERQNRMKTNNTQFYSGTEDFMVNVMPYLYGKQTKPYESNQKFMEIIKLIQSSLQDPTEILLILSDDFKRWSEADFKLVEDRIEYLKNNTNIHAFFSSTHNYFEKLSEKAANFTYNFENISDFYPLEDLEGRLWVGYFSTRPNLKLMARRFGLLSRSLKNLFSSFQIIRTQNETINITQDLYEACVGEFERHLGVLCHHDSVTGTLRKNAEADLWRLTKNVESNCREELDKSEIFEKQLFCNLLNNRDTCIIDFFKNDSNFSQKFRNFTKKILLRIFNPAQTKESMISFQIPNVNINVTLLDGNPIEFDTFCEEFNETTCHLYFKVISPGFQFLDLLLSATNDSAGINRNMTKISSEEIFNIDLHFDFPANLTIENNFSRFSYVNSRISKNFTLDLMYYEDKRLENCELFKGNNYFYGSLCPNRFIYSGAYIMKLEDGLPINFKNGMSVSAYYYRTKFFTKIIVQYENNTIISSLTFYPDYNKDPKILFIDTWTFLNDNIQLGFPISSGKEIILVIKDENLYNNGSFITDSNGLYNIQRQKRTPYNNDSSDIPVNFYPVVSKVSIKDNSSQAMTILNDRSQGATSYKEGEIQILIARYYRTDDLLGVFENYLTQEKIYINHQIIFHQSDELEKNEIFKKIINQKNFILLPFLQIYDNYTFYNDSQKENKENIKNFHIGLLSSLPPYIKINFHPLSIENNSMLIRIQDTIHESNVETNFHMAKIQNNLKHRCTKRNKNCTFIKFICENSMLDGIEVIENKLTKNNNIKNFTILSAICQENNVTSEFEEYDDFEIEEVESPKKEFEVKFILIVFLPVILLCLLISFGFYLRMKRLKTKEQEKKKYLELQIT